MTDSVEVAITSESSGQLWSVAVWDINTGSQLMAYKGGGVCGNHSLSVVGSDYIVAAEMTKPLLHVWPANSSETSHELRTVCPGIIGALAVSPDGAYIVAGIAEKIHIWQTESGRLMAVAARHYQQVTCIRFTEDSINFVSAGEDGMVLVWCISHAVAHDGVRLETVHSFSDHYLAVRDVFVGHGGARTRIVSVSIDGSCRIYDLASGSLLLSLSVHATVLTSVAADVLESSLFLGTNTGDILNVFLRDRPRQLEHHLTEEERNSLFKGHTKAVISLSPSQDATSLLSGSADETVRLWHIESRQCVRVIQHKGSVTNAFLTFIPSQMFAEKFRPSIVMHRLQRSSDLSENHEYNFEMLTMKAIDFTPSDNVSELGFISEFAPFENPPVLTSEADSAVSKELDELRRKNIELFKFASDKILSGISVNGSAESIPSLVNIEVALHQADQNSFNPEPFFKLTKKKKKKTIR